MFLPFETYFVFASFASILHKKLFFQLHKLNGISDHEKCIFLKQIYFVFPISKFQDLVENVNWRNYALTIDGFCGEKIYVLKKYVSEEKINTVNYNFLFKLIIIIWIICNKLNPQSKLNIRLWISTSNLLYHEWLNWKTKLSCKLKKLFCIIIVIYK